MRSDIPIPPYPYLPYVFDDKINAIFQGITSYAQDYIDSFNSLNLPIYNSKIGAFLDYVGVNLYGISRPVLPIGNITTIGEINNFSLNELELNVLITKYPNQFYIANDDVYKRVITWHHYKSDGELFNIRYLKRRIMRFLSNGDINQTYQISVSFGQNNQCNIIIYNNGRIDLRPSSVINDGELNSFALNEQRTQQIPFVKFDLAEVFKKCIETGTLEMPWQYQTNVTIE
ncbi:hypothetical protein UFOVP136_52 [uncultured Caudovirales phage]|uniref:Uncharacterized protein n=1 Tax=uncultured Caudovirales phage TaxID=2100421 RepID=A0A6J5LKJ6_9CAUD|nr:hypothetical protein UFOVP136_52 [uncultured Caudovirales phage]